MKILSITNIFNFSGTSLIIIFAAFLGFEDLAAELGIIIGCSIFFTQLFSSNSRNLLIIKFSKKNYKKRILVRVFFSILILLLINLFNFFYFKSLNIISITISIIIILQWVNELYLLNLWQNKNVIKIKLYLIICAIYYLFIPINFLIGNLKIFENMNILFTIINLIFLKEIFFDIKNTNLKEIKNSVFRIFFNDINNSSFYSSSSIVLSNFVSRIIIFESIPIKLSGTLFACYSIGSIPGSIFNNTFGPYLVKNKKNLLSFKFFLIFLMIVLFSIYLLIDKSEIIVFFPSIMIFTLDAISYSLIGSIFMIIGLYYRQLALFKNSLNIKNVFNIDILNSLVYITIVLSIVYVSKIQYFAFIFLIFAIYNFFIFILYFNYSKDYKIKNR
ncbi:hypothetical protein [Candidatus Pelagibacter bacterium nBUS_25]|uniref:hypothetical protein n=1 Tax=Candidatus Pelagibacter bacterium nBUS_25 TaxID=3374187 RepID=UPI003EBF0C95